MYEILRGGREGVLIVGAWAAATYYLVGLICLCLFTALSPTPLCDNKFIAHGKVRGKKTLKQKTITGAIPKQLFTIFYAVGLVCSFSLLSNASNLQVFFIRFHLCRRLLETILWPYRTGSQMHLIHALVGFTYYCVLIFTFHLSLNSSPTNQSPTFYQMLILLFASGVQCYCHWFLYTQRQRRHINGGIKPYVPITAKNFIFRKILCPHYTCEIIIYLTFAHINYSAPFGWLFILNFLFVTGNLAISAHTTQQWYKRKFPTAPQPYSIIPFVF